MSTHQLASLTDRDEIGSYDLYDDISDLIQGITLDGRFLFVNKAWCDALGYSRAEVAALNIFDVIHADCHEHCQGFMQKLMDGEEIGRVEVSFVAKDGQIIDVEGRVTLREKAGQPLATCGIFRDVSERKAAEKEIQMLNDNLMHLVAERTVELQKSETRFRDFIANIPGAMYELVIDADGNRSMPYISDGIEKLMGLRAADCMADVEILFRRIPHDVLIAVEESLQHSLENLTPWLHEFPICTVTGEQKWLYSHALPKRLDGATYWSGMLVDITSRKQVEANLYSVTDRLLLATRASGVGIWDWDIARNILTWDEAMFNLFGVSRHDFDGTFEAWRKTVHPDDLQQAEMAVQSVLRDKAHLDIEFRIIKPDGSIRHLIGLAALQFDALGQPVRMIGTNMDITKQRQSESRLLLAKEKAEKLSNELVAYIEAIGKLALVSVADLKGHITHANAKFCEISGYSEEELIGQDHRILNSAVHSKEFFREMWITIKQGPHSTCKCTTRQPEHLVGCFVV